MADLQITARYKSPGARLALWICMLFSPFWAVLCLIAALIGTAYLVMTFVPFVNFIGAHFSTVEQLYTALGPTLAFWLIFFGGMSLSLAFADNRIIASESGLRLPIFLTMGTHLRKHIPWEKITSMQIIGDPDKGIHNLDLRILASDLGEVKLWLGAMEATDVEKLLQSADVWLLPSAKGPLLESVREKLEQMPLLGRDRSQKQSFESELDSRFAATAFIPLEPGDELLNGSLKIIRQLSFGGLSAIYLAQENKTKLYVLKESVVPQDARAEVKSKAWELFRREAEILSQLDHPRIVKVIKSFEENEREYLLLQYLPGMNLRQLVRDTGPMDEAEVISLTRTMAEILAYLHAFRPAVIHRDITPENIILADDNQPVLIDFGVANAFLGTATGTLVGKHCYISPEQFRGKATTASDLYSLGCTMYFLLTGEDPTPLMQASPRTINENLSMEIDSLVRDLTDMEESRRLCRAEDLLDRLKVSI
ncbi:MAG: serine/threonine protein kinase [Cyanobacteria bacterium SZAS LIN-3]|nr:serine/threonine protein kinase [Cyanobacteria bacterium SZAS LIN-3]MBS2006866.1 serine/threonine protein kinase [Cyanobacteria bacterium SZAS TMP-1]